MSYRPAEIAGLSTIHGQPVAEGNRANLCVVDPDVEWTVSGAATASRSQNTAFDGRELKGRVVHTILDGELTVEQGEPTR